MKCPRCNKKASLIFSYVRRNGLNEYTKEAFGFLDRRKESVILRQYQCNYGHGQFLHLFDGYAFVDRTFFKLLDPHIDWRTKEEWQKIENELKKKKNK